MAGEKIIEDATNTAFNQAQARLMDLNDEKNRKIALAVFGVNILAGIVSGIIVAFLLKK